VAKAKSPPKKVPAKQPVGSAIQQLAAAVAAAPDDLEIQKVYADALLEHDDVRGATWLPLANVEPIKQRWPKQRWPKIEHVHNLHMSPAT